MVGVGVYVYVEEIGRMVFGDLVIFVGEVV